VEHQSEAADPQRSQHTPRSAAMPPPEAIQRRRPRGPRLWLGAIVVLAVIVAGVWYTHKPAAAAAARRIDADGGTVLVQSALAMHRDVPVYLTGLGTVQAFYTATMTARVNGEVMGVYFKEGQFVKKGQLLALIDPRPYKAALDQAMATEAKDSAQLLSAREDLQKYLQLAPHNLSSKQQVDDQRALVAQLVAQVQIDRAAIDNARTNLNYCSITAPFDGRTGIRLIDPGNNVLNTNNTNGIVVVTMIQPISVVFVLPEADLLRINRAMTVAHCQSQNGCVKVLALSQDGTTQLDSGSLTVVDNQIDTTTGTMKLKATFPNLDNTLWPGEFVNAEVLIQQLYNVVTVPTAAVQTGPDGHFIYVVKSNSTVEARPVTVGEQSDGNTVVTAGISAGERVVTNNQFRLQPGSRVLVAAAAPGTSSSD
jgi:membrane fusion protein, multidrug efflux system